jgi:hypothetical protein
LPAAIILEDYHLFCAIRNAFDPSHSKDPRGPCQLIADYREQHSKPAPVTVSCDISLEVPVMEIAGQSLTVAQLCDLIKAFTYVHPNSDFAVALNNAVETHGRFE